MKGLILKDIAKINRTSKIFASPLSITLDIVNSTNTLDCAKMYFVQVFETVEVFNTYKKINFSPIIQINDKNHKIKPKGCWKMIVGLYN